jgi:hypothetical protein
MISIVLMATVIRSHSQTAVYTDNCVSLLPGESREIEIEYPAKSANGPAQVALRGWNLAKQVVPAP